MQRYTVSVNSVSFWGHFSLKTDISLIVVNKNLLLLTCIKNIFLTFASGYENRECDIEGSHAVAAGRCDTLLDVSWRGLAAAVVCDDGRDGLDVDAAQLPLWHSGTDVSRMALAPDAGTSGRKPTLFD